MGLLFLSLLTARLLPLLAGLYFSQFDVFGRVMALEPDPPSSAEAVLAAVLHVFLLLRLSLPAQHSQHHLMHQGKPFVAPGSTVKQLPGPGQC